MLIFSFWGIKTVMFHSSQRVRVNIFSYILTAHNILSTKSSQRIVVSHSNQNMGAQPALWLKRSRLSSKTSSLKEKSHLMVWGWDANKTPHLKQWLTPKNRRILGSQICIVLLWNHEKGFSERIRCCYLTDDVLTEMHFSDRSSAFVNDCSPALMPGSALRSLFEKSALATLSLLLISDRLKSVREDVCHRAGGTWQCDGWGESRQTCQVTGVSLFLLWKHQLCHSVTLCAPPTHTCERKKFSQEWWGGRRE